MSKTTIEQLTDRFDAWTKEFRASRSPRIDKHWVHKHRDENVFIARMERVNEDSDEEFVGELSLDDSHDFFFEHPQDHFPGLMLLEAARQLATLCAHRYFDVPLTSAFILNGVGAEFGRFAELGQPVFVVCRITKKKYFKQRLTQMGFEGEFVQDDQSLGTITGRCSVFDEAMIARIRRDRAAAVASREETAVDPLKETAAALEERSA
jgi:hypothetical protein